MNRHEHNEPVERLLCPEARASLPLRRQLLLYLHPFALFKDANHSDPMAMDSALRYNRAMRWMLLAYLRRWLFIALVFYLGIAPAQALAAKTSLFIIPAAAFAVGACIAIAITACTLGAYVLLSAPRTSSDRRQRRW